MTKLKKYYPYSKYRQVFLNLILVITLAIIAINITVTASSRVKIKTNIADLEPAPVILILGAGVYSNNRVSQIVYDRILRTVELYRAGLADKILISGDHRDNSYNEVDTIAHWLEKYGVPKSALLFDPQGLSTYESIKHLYKNFGIEEVIIVTQKFHLPRAVFLAGRFNISSQGYVADRVEYPKARNYIIREYLARCKDFVYAFIKPSID